MSVESHRNGNGRGVGIYVMDDSGNLQRIGDNFTPDAKGSYTWHDWVLPDGVTEMDGKVDIYVKNTSGCHIYTIDATVADNGSNAITHHPSLVTPHPSTIYNLNGQQVAAPQHGLYIVNGQKVVVR